LNSKPIPIFISTHFCLLHVLYHARGNDFRFHSHFPAFRCELQAVGHDVSEHLTHLVLVDVNSDVLHVRVRVHDQKIDRGLTSLRKCTGKANTRYLRDISARALRVILVCEQNKNLNSEGSNGGLDEVHCILRLQIHAEETAL